MGRGLLLGLALGLLGCASEVEKQSTKLSLACEVTKCDCASDFMTLFDSQPVQWKPDGSASCPEGYHLRRLQMAPKTPL